LLCSITKGCIKKGSVGSDPAESTYWSIQEEAVSRPLDYGIDGVAYVAVREMGRMSNLWSQEGSGYHQIAKD